jgi:ribosomal protein S18 acetylase RimI-like enzyme
MPVIQYTETDRQGLDLIKPLWQQLVEHHKARSPIFYNDYAKMTFATRKKQLLEKSRKNTIRIDLARDENLGEFVGYCVSTISEERQGEIDSIYIKPDYRRFGIADNLMKRALHWMDEQLITKRILVVGAGNEEVLGFYSKYGFHPRNIVLEQAQTKKVKE